MTIFGLDFSHYDAVPDGARVVAEGFRFMTHKAGGDANDAELAAWWRALKPYRDRVLLGAYWVLYPGNPTGRADAFLARLDSQCGGWRDGPFILQADCEKWNGDVSTVPPRGNIRAFCDRLVAKAPKLKPIVYAPKWVYGESLTGLGYPLWASSYVTGAGTASSLYPGDTSSKWAPYSGQVPAILQFTSSANAVGQTTCDANAFRGTLSQLTALLAPGWSEDMTLDQDDVAAIVAGVRSGLDTAPIRNGRTLGGTLDALANDSVAARGVPAAVAALAGQAGEDTEAIVSGILAALTPAAIAAAIPESLAADVADEIAARLAS